MKSIGLVLLGLGMFIGGSVQAQSQNPDQNPNHHISAEKYAQQADVLLQNQGETIQATYKAYDWTEHKAEKKQARIDRRHELRMERARYNPYAYYGPYNYNGFGYYSNNTCNGILLGAGLYHLLF